jgi:hypothetical protein
LPSNKKVEQKEKDEENHIQALVQNNFKNVLKSLHIKVAQERIIPSKKTNPIQYSLPSNKKVEQKEKDEENHIQALVQNNFKNVLKSLHIKVEPESK